MGYDSVGNVTSTTDAKGKTTYNFYDQANRVIRTQQPSVYYGTPVTYYYHDKGGNIIQTKDPNNKSVYMHYDTVGRLTNTVDAASISIKFEYDENGNQTALIDGKNNRTEFIYDGLNRQTQTTYPGKPFMNIPRMIFWGTVLNAPIVMGSQRTIPTTSATDSRWLLIPAIAREPIPTITRAI